MQEPDHRLENAQFAIPLGTQPLITSPPVHVARPAAGLYEGAEFWRHIMNELWNRAVEDIPFPVVDGLKVFDYCTTIFPVICG